MTRPAETRELVARAICAAYGDVYDEQPPDLKTLREWRAREGTREPDGTGIVRSYDPGLPTQSDWLECADAALAAIEASGRAVVSDDIYNALAASRKHVHRALESAKARVPTHGPDYLQNTLFPYIADIEADLEKIDVALDSLNRAARPPDVAPTEKSDAG